MIEATGITLREAIEAILVIFIMSAYLEKTGEAMKKKYVYAGAIAAVLLSIVLAAVLIAMGIEPENELVEGVLFIIAGILVASLVVWMWRKAKVIKQEVEAKVAGATSTLALALIAFVMVFREGVETVIFLQGLLLAGSSPVENFLGAMLGIALAVVFGAVFLKGTARINLPRFFKVTSAILAVLVVKLIASGFHEFFEVGLLPTNEALMSFVGIFARDSTGAVIIMLMLAALIALVVYDVATARPPNLSHLKSAERRKLKFEFLKEKYSKIGLGTILLLVVGLVLMPSINASDVITPEPVPVSAADGWIEVAVPREDGLYIYMYNNMRFLIAVGNGKAHVALDRCYICPPKGYGYDGEVLICLNCGAPINLDTVGIPGGCNPVVLEYSIDGEKVKISTEELARAWSQS